MTETKKPWTTPVLKKATLCLDFDGVIHGYQSGWQGADVITDPPVPGAIDFIKEALNHFQVAIYSSRSHQTGGIKAMQDWLTRAVGEHYGMVPVWIDMIEWPTHKPAAFITIDDRCIPFDGTWPAMKTLLEFKPWNKRT